MVLIVFCTVLTLSAMYAPQPLLPVLAREFGVSREAAAALTTVAFIPLSVAPLIYGYLLETVSPKRVLRSAVGLLALSEIVFYFGDSFSFLLFIRVIQGLLIPAILTALMTYLARINTSGTVQKAMGIYISATIVGGFLGRACSGLFASWFGWRSSFLLLAASLLLCFVLLVRLPDLASASLLRPRPGLILDLLRRPGFLKLYLAVFGLFLVFSGVMNYLPFRFAEISEQADELRTGLMYTGYMIGVATSLSASRLAGRFGAIPIMGLGLMLFLFSVLGLWSGSALGLFAMLFLFCAAMFLVHSAASGYLNRLAGDNKGLVNGLYVAFYYAGGVVGSYFPGFVYRSFGWSGFLLLMLLVAAGSLGMVVLAGRHTEPNIKRREKGASGTKK